MDLSGKTCVVTGASRGIGKAAALAIGEAGANVVVSARDSDGCRAVAAAITEAGGRSLAVPADVTDEAAVAALVEQAAARFGSVELAFLNAGNILPPAPVETIATERFDALLNVNLRGVFFGLRALLPPLKAQGGAVVVNSAGSGLRGRAGLADYCASKWGVIGLAMAVAQEAGSAGVRVNVIAPGYIASDSWLDMLGGSAGVLAGRVPLRRIGTPEEVGNTVAWLLSDEARYVSGAVIPVDGGMLSG